jgi:hypothetical protein
VKFVGEANQNEAVEQSQVCQVRSEISGVFTWYRADVASGANCSAFFAKVRNMALL